SSRTISNRPSLTGMSFSEKGAGFQRSFPARLERSAKEPLGHTNSRNRKHPCNPCRRGRISGPAVSGQDPSGHFPEASSSSKEQRSSSNCFSAGSWEVRFMGKLFL